MLVVDDDRVGVDHAAVLEPYALGKVRIVRRQSIVAVHHIQRVMRRDVTP